MLAGSRACHILRSGRRVSTTARQQLHNTLSTRQLILLQARRPRYITTTSRVQLAPESQQDVSEGVTRTAPAPAAAPAVQASAAKTTKATPNDINDWVKKLDRFLPLELRSGSWQENLASFEGVRTANYLPKLLAEANDAFPTGLLTHVVLVQRRWAAGLFLCQALFKNRDQLVEKSLDFNRGSPWSSLKALNAIDVDFTDAAAGLYNLRLFSDRSRSSMDELPLDTLTSTSFKGSSETTILWREAFGNIWRCIGHTMLAATREHSPLQVDMLRFVLQAIASAHTEGAISESIYQFDHEAVSASTRKHPFLHLMSSRIMTALSDVTWKKVEPEIMRDVAYVVASHAHKGVNSPAGEFGPRLRALKHEVWMELILWSCVHGEHFREGIELIQSMSEGDPSQRWKTTPWCHLETTLEERLAARESLQKARSWYERLASSMEGYSEESPLVELDERTVSQEVVARLCDGLLSELPSTTESEQFNVIGPAEKCMDILGPPMDLKDFFHRVAILYRISDATPHAPGILTQGTSEEFTKRWSIQKAVTLANQADLQHTLLVKSLAHHVHNSNTHDALDSYTKLKAWFDNIADAEEESATNGSKITERSGEISGTHPFIPASVFASLVDILAQSSMFDTARRLITESNIWDGSDSVHEIAKRSTALADAVLHTKSARPERSLLNQNWDKGYVEDNLISAAGLSQLIQTAINDCNVYMVRVLLNTKMIRKNMQVTINDVARLAAGVIELENKQNSRLAKDVGDVLQEVLSGTYRTKTSPGEPPNWTEPRMLNQMSRIIASLPLRNVPSLSTEIQQLEQLNNPIAIHSTVFNILLRAVVHVYGLEQAKSFVSTWCTLNYVPRGFINLGHKPVKPNLHTLRILLKPFTARFRGSYKHRDYNRTRSALRGQAIPRSGFADTGQSREYHEGLLKYYYGRNVLQEHQDLETVYWVMDICEALRYDEGGIFYSLLLPIEEVDVNVNDEGTTIGKET